MPEAVNISHDSSSPRASGAGRNWPVFSAKYSKMALLSKTVVDPSTMTGTLALGLMAVNPGVCCSPLRVSTGIGS
jgi:hypothetical protein